MTCWVCSAVRNQSPDRVPATQTDLLTVYWVTVYLQCSAGVVESVAGLTEPEVPSCPFNDRGWGGGLSNLAGSGLNTPTLSSSGALAGRNRTWAGWGPGAGSQSPES